MLSVRRVNTLMSTQPIPARTAILLVVVLAGMAGPFRSSHAQELHARVIAAAIDRTTRSVTYDGSYRAISYPNGDVPDDVGVCTDLVVRAYRAVDLDLQALVHKDMQLAFDDYPDLWGLTRPDPNIDHRRVPNLQAFFRRNGESLPVTRNPADFAPGDLVTWMLPGNLPHVGLVTDRRTSDGDRPLIVHNIGRGPVLEDMLLRFQITGHYRYPENEE